MQARTQDMLTLRLIKLYPFRPSVRLSYGQDRPFRIYTLSGATSRKAFQNAQGTDASLHTVYSGNPRSQEVFPFGRTFQPIDCPLVLGFCSLDPTCTLDLPSWRFSSVSSGHNSRELSHVARLYQQREIYI